MSDDPIQLLFGGMEKLGPGSDTDTLLVLGLLPEDKFDVTVDAGCGSGRQTLALARELGSKIHAIDSHEPFLIDLTRLATDAGLADLVHTHCMDMQDIPGVFPEIDLLWCEGAAYNIGFTNALTTWASSIRPGGFLVVSELCWLKSSIPNAVRDFFAEGYPDMKSADEIKAIATEAGYKVLATHTLPRNCWTQGYYEILQPRATELLDHSSKSVRAFAAGTLEEIRVFEQSEGSYGYTFLVLSNEE